MPVPAKSKLGACDYCKVHEMRRIRVPVQLCDLCGKYFCDEHIQPKVPQYSIQIEGRKSRLDDTRKPGHPCPLYVEIVKTREKERRIRTQEALQKMDGEKAINPKFFRSWEKVGAYAEAYDGKGPGKITYNRQAKEIRKGETERMDKAIQKVMLPSSQKTSEKPSGALLTHSTKKKAALAAIAFVIFLLIVILIFHMFS